MNRTTRIPRILLPREGIDLRKWSVVACDQFTSQPDYWARVEYEVGKQPSTLHLTLPEIYLEKEDVADRTKEIHRTMKHYLAAGILRELPPGVILTQRDTGGSCPRRGIVLAFDLEDYDYRPGSSSLIRPTEKTVEERIPPRLAVRKGAVLELPHIMLLIDDPTRSVIEPLFERTAALERIYDIELNQNGGRLTGWFLPEGKRTDWLERHLARLSDRAVFNAKYGVDDSKPVLPFAVGDGNHSMATAKAAWEQLKPTLSEADRETHPARFVLAEVVNIHDESIEIEGIFRVLFGVKIEHVLEAAKVFFEAREATISVDDQPDPAAQSFPFESVARRGYLNVMNSPWELPVATLQRFLDVYLADNPTVKIDYIHGRDTLHDLSMRSGNLGFTLPDPAKEDLFRGVIFDGVLPRKTFSMGEAREKRYYMEAKRIL